ncbi:MAG: nuclear transport factor 2 family protein [Hyphomicrobiales bacterium]|nr:MAG: nuclear transport factor 2 family protein [Hyphomicrobiales bacterium]
MAMSRAEMDAIVDDHFRFEATDDLDGVMSSFADGPVQHEIIPSPVGVQTDRAAMRAYYAMLYRSARGDNATTIRRLYGDDFMIDETLWEGEIVDGAVFLCPGKTGKSKNRLLHIFTFRDGKIASEQAWLDLAAIQQHIR